MKQGYPVFIEIPQGTRNNKYERDPKTGLLVLDFIFENFVWPFNYGEILNTKGGDGDALDAVVFSSQPLQMGSIAFCVPFGFVKMLDRGARDDKILMVPEVDPLSQVYKELDDFSQSQRHDLEDLYKEIARQKQKKIEVLSFENKQAVLDLIEQSFNHLSEDKT